MLPTLKPLVAVVLVVVIQGRQIERWFAARRRRMEDSTADMDSASEVGNDPNNYIDGNSKISVYVETLLEGSLMELEMTRRVVGFRIWIMDTSPRDGGIDLFSQGLREFCWRRSDSRQWLCRRFNVNLRQFLKLLSPQRSQEAENTGGSTENRS